MKPKQLFCCGLLALLGALPAPAASSTNALRHCCCQPAPAAAQPLTDKSLYQLDSAWTNDSAQTVKLTTLRGRPQVVVMFFAHCQYACPLLVYQMQQLEAALPPAVRTNLGFTLVSFDTRRDTPAALHEYRTVHQLSPANWTLLKGEPDAVQDLAALLGVKFKDDAQGQFSHSNLITLLNAEGEIVHQQTGLTTDTRDLVQAVEKLAPVSLAAGVVR